MGMSAKPQQNIQALAGNSVKPEAHDAPPGYKRTEVGVIPEEWEIRYLAQMGVLRSGNGFPTAFQGQVSGDYPFFKVSDMNNAGNELFMRTANHWICESVRKRLGAIAFQPGSIIFAKIGAAIFLERKRILERASCLDNNMMAFSLIDTEICQRFFFYLFLRIVLGKLVSTTALPSLSGREIGALQVPIPPIPEQHAIAEALSAVDGLLAAMDQLIAKKRAIKQAAMQQLLIGQTRLPGFCGKWEKKQLGEVVTIGKGQLITEALLEPGKVPVIAGGMKPAYFHSQSNRTGKTITVSASGANAGYVAFWDMPIFASDCSTISEGSTYSIEFIYYQLLLKQEDIYYTQTGGAQPHVHPKDLYPITIMIPKLPEQTAIAAVLFDMDAEIEALVRRREKVQQIKQGMMQQLLTGRIRLV